MKKLKTKYLPKLLIIIQFVIFYNFLSDNLLAYKNSSNELWKKEIQKLLGFSQSDISGIMDEKTFESLKFFAIRNNISDIFLYREYQDIGVLGFQEYMEKYHEYWLEKLNDRQLLINISNKEYLKNANEILYELELSIQNAKLELELLSRSKLIYNHIEKEKYNMDDFENKKEEVNNVILKLDKSVKIAEEEVEKWNIEQKKYKDEDKRQLDILQIRKNVAAEINSDLEDAIDVAKKSIDDLVKGNDKLIQTLKLNKETLELVDALELELDLIRLQLADLTKQKENLSRLIESINNRLKRIDAE